ncbi:MAG TPA: hypothetical protein VF524_12055 [Polyangia bacterium]
MGRLLHAYLAFTAALGLSGCLLFTDPINKAPTVTINDPTDPVVFGIPTAFTAKVTDDKDNPSSLLLDWAEFTPLAGCKSITPATWVSPNRMSSQNDSTAPYILPADSVTPLCLCARTTDHNGATGIGCTPNPITRVPVATIVDVSGALSGPPQRLLCSQVHLYADNSGFASGDQLLQFTWTISYTGTDPAGKSIQLAPCTGVAEAIADQHRCFYAGSPGTYAVTLSITDTATSNTDTFSIPVDVDRPPCINRTDPDVYAKRILLSHSTDLGGSYQSRTFKVLNVVDDCEPYPLPAGSTHSPTQFVWWVLDSTQDSPIWTRQTNTSDSFTVSQAMFPNARPGDTIELRVEAQDKAVQKFYQAGGQVCAKDVDICCGSTACGTPTDCVRWTTWTVQFQP